MLDFVILESRWEGDADRAARLSHLLAARFFP